jgi:hypothetical protein
MITRAQLEQLTEFDTALLANTIGYIDPTPAEQWYMGGMIQSMTPGLGPTVGLAAVSEVDTSTPGSDPDVREYHRQLGEFDRSDLPVVWVVKAVGSRPEHECVLGDGMAKLLTSVGCVGMVTDGGVRDVDGLLSTSFAAYARGVVIHHCALRFRPAEGPVEVGGIEVATGDVIHADKGGVIKVPPGCIERLPERASALRAFEHERHAHLRRTDIDLAEKLRILDGIKEKYGF